MKILVLVSLLVSLPVMAQSIGAQDVEPLLQQMQASGKITAQEAAATRKHIQTMKADDWRALEEKAVQEIERNPAAAERLTEETFGGFEGSESNLSNP